MTTIAFQRPTLKKEDLTEVDDRDRHKKVIVILADIRDTATAEAYVTNEDIVET